MFTKGEVNYRNAVNRDRCGICKSFVEPYGCLKVAGNIDSGFVCDIGHSALDGHAFNTNAPFVHALDAKYTRDHAAAHYRVGNSPYYVTGYRTQRRELVYLITDEHQRWDERLGVYPTPNSAEAAAMQLVKRGKGKTL